VKLLVARPAQRRAVLGAAVLLPRLEVVEGDEAARDAAAAELAGDVVGIEIENAGTGPGHSEIVLRENKEARASELADIC
jgi:hypothetical protein